MNWKVVRLEPGEHRKGTELVTQFKTEFVGSGSPQAAALFVNHDTKHAHSYYFSPTAAQIFGAALETAGATDSGAPVAGSATFLAGSEDHPLA